MDVSRPYHHPAIHRGNNGYRFLAQRICHRLLCRHTRGANQRFVHSPNPSRGQAGGDGFRFGCSHRRYSIWKYRGVLVELHFKYLDRATIISSPYWGGLFLCYLGIRTLLAEPMKRAALTDEEDLVGAYASIFFLTLTNPMTILYFVALFVGLGMTGTGRDFLSAIALIFGVFIGSLAWFLILCSSFDLFRDKFDSAGLRWDKQDFGGNRSEFWLGCSRKYRLTDLYDHDIILFQRSISARPMSIKGLSISVVRRLLYILNHLPRKQYRPSPQHFNDR